MPILFDSSFGLKFKDVDDDAMASTSDEAQAEEAPGFGAEQRLLSEQEQVPALALAQYL